MVYIKYPGARTRTRKKNILDGGAPKIKASKYSANPTLHQEKGAVRRFFARATTSQEQRVKNDITGKTGFSGEDLTKHLNITQQKERQKILAVNTRKPKWYQFNKTIAQKDAIKAKITATSQAKQATELQKVIRLAQKRGETVPADDIKTFTATNTPKDKQEKINTMRKVALNIVETRTQRQLDSNAVLAKTANETKIEFQSKLQNAQSKRSEYKDTTLALEEAKQQLKSFRGKVATPEISADAEKILQTISELTEKKAKLKQEVRSINTTELKTLLSSYQKQKQKFSKTTLAGRQQRLLYHRAGLVKPKTITAKGIITGNIERGIRKASKTPTSVKAQFKKLQLEKKLGQKQQILGEAMKGSLMNAVQKEQMKLQTQSTDAITKYLGNRKNDPEVIKKFEAYQDKKERAFAAKLKEIGALTKLTNLNELTQKPQPGNQEHTPQLKKLIIEANALDAQIKKLNFVFENLKTPAPVASVVSAPAPAPAPKAPAPKAPAQEQEQVLKFDAGLSAEFSTDPGPKLELNTKAAEDFYVGGSRKLKKTHKNT
jgi:hypothetical protein